jgi:hypothetical protein
MKNMKSIQIDPDVFQALRLKQLSDGETLNTVLRRVLGLKQNENHQSQEYPESGRPWIVEDVVFPQGTRFRGRYKGYYYYGQVNDGVLELNGQRFHSPTAAAFSITRKPFFSGWDFWEIELPGAERGSWECIARLKGHCGRKDSWFSRVALQTAG